MLFISYSSSVALRKYFSPLILAPLSSGLPQGTLSAFWQKSNKRHIVCANVIALTAYRTLYTVNFVGVQMTTGLMSVKNCTPQMLNVCLPQCVSTGQCPGSKKCTVHFINLRFRLSTSLSPNSLSSMERDDRSGQSSGSIHVLHVQQNINLSRRCLAGTDVPNQPIWLKSTPWKNMPHLILTTISVCLHAVSLSITSMVEDRGTLSCSS